MTDDSIEPTPVYQPRRDRRFWFVYAAIAVLFVAVLLDFTGRLSGHSSTQRQIRDLACNIVKVDPNTTEPSIVFLRHTYDCMAYIPISSARP